MAALFLDAADVQTSDAELERRRLDVCGPGALAATVYVTNIIIVFATSALLLLLGSQIGNGLFADQTLNPRGDAVEFVLDLQ